MIKILFTFTLLIIISISSFAQSLKKDDDYLKLYNFRQDFLNIQMSHTTIKLNLPCAKYYFRDPKDRTFYIYRRCF